MDSKEIMKEIDRYGGGWYLITRTGIAVGVYHYAGRASARYRAERLISKGITDTLMVLRLSYCSINGYHITSKYLWRRGLGWVTAEPEYWRHANIWLKV